MDNEQPAMLRLAAYSLRRKQARGIDVNSVHGFDVGPNRGVELTLADIDWTLAEIERLREHAVVLAETARLVERERCIEWCKKVQAHHEAKQKTDDEVQQAFVDGEACGAEDCIEAINAEGNWP